MSTSPLIFDSYIINNIVGTSVLDVGCGHGKWGYLVKKYAKPGSTQPFVCGIDIFEPHIVALQREKIYDKVELANACDIPFSDNSFDTVIACEVLEHQPQENQAQLIEEVRRVAKKCFIVTTPNFPCLRGGGETLDGYNDYEAHLHICSYDEFKSFNFTHIIGVGPLNIRPWKLSVGLSHLGLFYPKLSRYFIGFWFADGKPRTFSFD